MKDKALNAAYRAAYATCKGKYALSVPFMELFFQLVVRGEGLAPAGFVGQITSNSFMKREFGSKVIEQLLSGRDIANPVDLTGVIDTSGAYIPGHGTPTVILIGRRRSITGRTVRAVLGIRGEPGQPADPKQGLVWTEIAEHLEEPGFDGDYVSVTDLDRETLASHPWSLAGGGAGELKETIDVAAARLLGDWADELGITAVTGEDSLYMLGRDGAHVRMGVEHVTLLVEGVIVRDFALNGPETALWTYDAKLEALPLEQLGVSAHWLAMYRTVIDKRKRFGTPMVQRGLAWWEWQELYSEKLRTPLSIAFAFVATHNHFVLDRGGKVFKQSAPVIKLPEGASEDDHLALLGVLNSSAACFWLKQVSHNKGRPGAEGAGADEPWEHRFEFTGTKLQEFPLPKTLPLEYGRRLDRLAQRLASRTPAAICDSGAPSRARLDAAHEEYETVRAEMIAVQEELDWYVYGLYGLLDQDLTLGNAASVAERGSPDSSGSMVSQSPPESRASPAAPAAPAAPVASASASAPEPGTPESSGSSDLPGLDPGDRAFAIVLARRMETGLERTSYFSHHNHKFTPISEMPESWPRAYRDLVQRRLDLMESDRSIRLLERPEFKRRWQSKPWSEMEQTALRDYILDRLEAPQLWSDSLGPRIQTVAALAMQVRHDSELTTAVSLLTGETDPNLAAVLGQLLADEAVPFLAAHRYTPAGMSKRAEWEQVWDLQRLEDQRRHHYEMELEEVKRRRKAGEQFPDPVAPESVDIQVPPKYGQKDFRKTSYWRARGKLDVPKERFVSYPAAGLNPSELVLGWAGWDHAEQARALARLVMERTNEEGWTAEQITPLLAGLAELEPWLQQWYADSDPAIGTSASDAITGLLDQQLVQHGLTRNDLADWRPAAPVRGRRTRRTS